MLAEGAKILDIIKALFGLKDSYAKARAERRKNIAGLFLAMADCLEATAREIRDGSYPTGRCAELEQHALELPSVVGEEIGDQKAEEIRDRLLEAHRVEQLFSGRDSETGIKELDALEEAAGMLRAMSRQVVVV